MAEELVPESQIRVEITEHETVFTKYADEFASLFWGRHNVRLLKSRKSQFDNVSRITTATTRYGIKDFYRTISLSMSSQEQFQASAKHLLIQQKGAVEGVCGQLNALLNNVEGRSPNRPNLSYAITEDDSQDTGIDEGHRREHRRSRPDFSLEESAVKIRDQRSPAISKISQNPRSRTLQRRCSPGCTCSCHTLSSIRSHSALSMVIGDLSLTYTPSMAKNRPCNQKSCRNRSSPMAQFE